MNLRAKACELYGTVVPWHWYPCLPKPLQQNCFSYLFRQCQELKYWSWTFVVSVMRERAFIYFTTERRKDESTRGLHIWLEQRKVITFPPRRAISRRNILTSRRTRNIRHEVKKSCARFSISSFIYVLLTRGQIVKQRKSLLDTVSKLPHQRFNKSINFFKIN